jgi:hypothetical protein
MEALQRNRHEKPARRALLNQLYSHSLVPQVAQGMVGSHVHALVLGVSPAEAFMKTMADNACAHITEIDTLKLPKHRECEECVKLGAQWVHLRTCQECGATLCCDNSPNRHATKHARASGHPVIASAEIGERWLYCYPDDRFAEY